MKFMSCRCVLYIKIIHKASSTGEIISLIFSWIMHIFHFCFNLSIFVSSLFRLYVKLSGNSYLAIDKSGNFLIYLLCVKLWVGWQQMRSFVITVSLISAWWDISPFRHNENEWLPQVAWRCICLPLSHSQEIM